MDTTRRKIAEEPDRRVRVRKFLDYQGHCGVRKEA